MISTSPSARLSPMPTQLNGRTIVYGSPYWSQARPGEVLDRELLEAVRRERRRDLAARRPRTTASESVDSNTIDELMYVTFCSRPSRCAAMAASHDAAMMRSFVASRS